jgi:uncharacterized protein (TIGR02246 family)
MNILLLNAGSRSLKAALMESAQQTLTLIVMENDIMRKRACFAIASAAVAVATIGCLAAQQLAGKSAEGKAGDENADTAAVKKAGQSFLKAYLDRDAKAMAAHWTENGEYFADDGTVMRGRAEIEKAYSELFAKKNPRTDAEIDVTSIRFPSKDTAIEEGYFKVRTGKGPPTSSKYTVLHVREGDKWLMAVVREWPSEGMSIHDLDWLIGAWEAKRDDSEVRTTYEWWGDKSFLRVSITITKKGEKREGFQMIGKDRSTGQIRSWTFDRDGGFGEATWSRDGKKWIQESAGVLEDGSVLAATNILTPIDDDSFTFQSVQRSVGGEDADDIPPVRVTRVKGK